MNWLHPDHRADRLAQAAADWRFPADTIYLNHGSFGPAPRSVRQARQQWQERQDEQPMQFYVRELEPAWLSAREKLATWIGARADDVAFVENATYGMNVVAQSVALEPGDEVLLNNHEYGAVRRIWRRACDQQGARLVEATLPLQVETADDLLAPLWSAVTERTRVIVISHITSATAITMPVEAIVRQAHERGILVCIDGPHAVAQLSLNLSALDADFYTASCHKWLCAPLGTGFLHVAARHHATIRPALLSWGRLLPNMPERWDEQFRWTGTRDYSPYLAVPAAIEFLESFGVEAFREATHAMARATRRELISLLQQPALVPDDPAWYGCMTEVWLPSGDWSDLQQWLRHEEGIEVPIIALEDRWAVRVSCHLYTRPLHVERLLRGLRRALDRVSRMV
ncbi:MAG: aminotransferase class V-fold PLP-dependent enzyme [Planctomycetales bacterium]|nr:aminotransferase class V-fold PLP-dependent enzyme [Planctomycetales bacterium]